MWANEQSEGDKSDLLKIVFFLFEQLLDDVCPLGDLSNVVHLRPLTETFIGLEHEECLGKSGN